MRFANFNTHPCSIPRPCDPSGAGGNGGSGSNPNCADPNYRATHLNECGGDDPRCSDPAFAAANPSLCLNTPRLVLKPATATVEVLGEVLYKAYLWKSGQETLLTDGVTFSVVNSSIALIGASSGNAIGAGEGITAIQASYGDMRADAQLEVIAVGGCADRSNHFLLAFDVSNSSSAPFGSGYSTRLSAANAFGLSFVDHLNLTKDDAAVLPFNTGVTRLQDLTQDTGLLKAAINGLSSTSSHTSLAEALQGAIDFFADNVVTGTRIVVLFTDGENNTGADPAPIAESLRQSGVILIIVGLRAKGNAFRLLQNMASAGFFLNALPSNASSIADYLNGLKSYICSGNCTPAGDITIGEGMLNFNAFTNWDIIAGHVDLIGHNPGGISVFDLVPGNGLYLDGCGSTNGVPGGDKGTIRTKSRFVWTAGKEYSLTLSCDGNEREAGTDVTTIFVYDKNDLLIDSKVITITDFAQGFADYVLTFTPTVGQAGGMGGKIVVEQTSIRAGGTGVFGNLWNRVTLRNNTDDTTLFDDTFDNENPTYVPPACGAGDFATYGYACYDYGCIDSPIPAQVADPNPLPSLEGETEAQSFTGVAEATACIDCDTNQLCETRVATATSDISQADANAKAYAAAFALAQAAALAGCVHDLEVGDVINIQFKPEPPSDKLGFAVLGISSVDRWNQHAETPTVNQDGENVGVTFMVRQGGTFSAFATHPDPLMRNAQNASEASVYIPQEIAFFGLPEGTYSLVMYAHGTADADDAVITPKTCTLDPNTWALTNVVTLASENTADGAGWQSATWTEFEQYVRYDDIALTAGRQIYALIEKFDGSFGPINGIQLKRTA